MTDEKPFPLHIILLVLLGWVAIGFPRMLISPLLPTIEAEFQASHALAALLMSSYLLPYAIVQLPAGSLSDRFGNRSFMILAMLGTSVGSLLLSFTSTFNQAIAVRVLSGTLSGFWFTTSSKTVILNTDRARQGRALGITYSGGAIANIFIYFVVGASSTAVTGWRPYFAIGSIPGFICLALVCFLIKDVKENNGRKEDQEATISLTVFLKYLRSRPLASTLTFNFLTSLAGWSLGAFMPTYLVLDRGLLVTEAASVMIVQAGSSIFNTFLGGYVTDRFGFKVPVVASVVVMCSLSLLIPISPLGMPMWILLLVWGLIGGWSFVALNLYILNTVPGESRGIFLGTNNQVGFISATVGPPIFGFIIDIAGFRSFFTLSLVLYMVSLAPALLIRNERHSIEEHAHRTSS